jgi:hypothetical protein
MKLADLLVDSGLEDLQKIAHEHARSDDNLPRPQLIATIEGVLKSYRFLHDFLLNRQPPTFAIVTLLLDEPGFALPTTGFRDRVMAETTRICDAIDSGEVLKRDGQLRVYRRVLYQARSNDMQIDASESAILSVLRQELDISPVEHFIIEHHADLREFWGRGGFAREFQALRSAGLVFVKEDPTVAVEPHVDRRCVLLPEDLVPMLRQVLGNEMPRPAVRRLFQRLSNQDLHAALQASGAALSGSKEERIERLLAHMVQPRTVLRGLGIEMLRGICRDIGATVGGLKEDLVERIVIHLSAGRDIVGEPEPAPPPPAEPRRLSQARFGLLFGQIRALVLGGILGEFGLRRWGTKEVQVSTLWEANRSESTLLGALSNAELDVVLRRVNLKTGGSKSDRIGRLVDHFESLDDAAVHTAQSAATQLDSTDDTLQ